MRFFGLFGAIFFLAMSILQFNDPDWWIWIVVYWYPMALGILAFAKKSMRVLVHVSAALYGILFLIFFRHLNINWWDTEMGREAAGLSICFLWILLLSIFEQRQEYRRKMETEI